MDVLRVLRASLWLNETHLVSSCSPSVDIVFVSVAATPEGIYCNAVISRGVIFLTFSDPASMVPVNKVMLRKRRGLKIMCRPSLSNQHPGCHHGYQLHQQPGVTHQMGEEQKCVVTSVRQKAVKNEESDGTRAQKEETSPRRAQIQQGCVINFN